MAFNPLKEKCVPIEKQDPEALLPQSLPEIFKFQSNVDYVRGVLSLQISLTGDETRFVPVENLPKNHRYFMYQSMVNAKGHPGEAVVESLVKMSRHADAIPAVWKRLRQPQA